MFIKNLKAKIEKLKAMLLKLTGKRHLTENMAIL